MWSLVGASGVLDVNSPYAYLLVCSHFAATSVVAEREGALAGFVAAYACPERRDTVFVWQVGVAASARGCGLATRMLDRVVRCDPRFRYLEATITDSNHASWALFRGFARRRGAACREAEGFAATLFPPGLAHEAEVLVRIGPLGPYTGRGEEHR